MLPRAAQSCQARLDALQSTGASASASGFSIDAKIEVRKTDGDKKSKICACLTSRTARVLAAIGATRAAAMHASRTQPTSTELVVHMEDEEVYLHPVVLRIADRLDAMGGEGPTKRAALARAYVSRIEAEHGEIRKLYTSKGLVPPPEVIGPHGDAEDRFIADMSTLILLEAATMRRERGK